MWTVRSDIILHLGLYHQGPRRGTKPCGGRFFTTKGHEGARSLAAEGFLPLRDTKGHEALRRKGFTTKYHEEARSFAAEGFLPPKDTKKHEALRRKGFTTKGHEGARSLAASYDCKAISECLGESLVTHTKRCRAQKKSCTTQSHHTTHLPIII